MLEILTLGHIRYLDNCGTPLSIELITLDYDLRSKYEPEDYAGVVREFIYWHESLKDNENKE